MVKIAMAEDEKECQDVLLKHIRRFAKEHDLQTDVKVFSDGTDLTDPYVPGWDVIFLDIRMKWMDGMAAAKKIREVDESVIIIFITTLAQYAIKGYEVGALDFVLKPVTYEQFEMRMKKVVRILGEKVKDEVSVIVPIEDGKARIPARKILYIEVMGHDLSIVTEKETYEMRMPLREMEEKLTDYHFARCAKAYLVNLRQVKHVSADQIQVTGHELPLSRSYRKAFLETYSGYLGQSI